MPFKLILMRELASGEHIEKGETVYVSLGNYDMCCKYPEYFVYKNEEVISGRIASSEIIFLNNRFCQEVNFFVAKAKIPIDLFRLPYK